MLKEERSGGRRGVRDLMDLMDLMKNWAHFSCAFTVRASPLAICTIREILSSYYDQKNAFCKTEMILKN